MKKVLVIIIVLFLAISSFTPLTQMKALRTRIIKVYDTGPFAKQFFILLVKSGYKAVLIDPVTGEPEYHEMKKILSDAKVEASWLQKAVTPKSILAAQVAEFLSKNLKKELVLDLVRIIRGDQPKEIYKYFPGIDPETAYLALKALEITEDRDPNVFILKNISINLRNAYAKMEHWLVDLRKYDADMDKIADELEDVIAKKTYVEKIPKGRFALLLDDEVIVYTEEETRVYNFTDDSEIWVNVAAADADLEAAINVFESLGGRVIAVYKEIDAFSGYIPLAKIPELTAYDEIGYVELHHTNYYPLMAWTVLAMRVGTNDSKLVPPSQYPYYSLTPWGMGYTGDPNTAIAIVDTGIDDTHPLTGPYGDLDWTAKIIHWEDFSGDGSTEPEDYNGHGSHCAGIAAGNYWANDYVEWIILGRNRTSSASSSETYYLTINVTGYYAVAVLYYVKVEGFLPSTPSAEISITVYDPAGNQIATGREIANGSSRGWTYAYAYEIEQAVFNAQTTGQYHVTVTVSGDTGGYMLVTWERQYPNGGEGSKPGVHAGVAPSVKLVGLKIFNNQGSYGDTNYNAEQWLVNNAPTYHIVVSSNSWGGPDDATLDQYMNQVVQSGVVTVVAAGNDGYGANLGSPASADLVITVAALNDYLNVSSYSSAGDTTTGNTVKPDIAAIGGAGYYNGRYIDPEDSDVDGSSGAVAATDSNDVDNSPAGSGPIGGETSTLNNFWDIQGTSMATPHVSGIAALVIDAMGGWSAWQYDTAHALKVKMILIMTAVKWRGVEDSSSYPLPYNPRTVPKDNITGYGVVQADAAILAVTNELKPGNSYTGYLGSSSTNIRDIVMAPKCWAGYIYLEAGTPYRFELDVPDTADFDLYIYSGTPDEYGQPVVVAKSENGYGVDEVIEFTPSTSGIYYVVVKWYDPRYEGYQLWQNYGQFTLTIKELVPPSVQITSPANGTYFNTETVTIDWSASDNYALSHYEIYSNGTLVDTVASTGSTSETKSYTLTNLADGYYEVIVRAYDTSGNYDEALVTFYVDTTPPTVSIDSPADGSYLRGVVAVTVSANDANFDRVELYINGTFVASWTTPGTNTYSWNTTQYADGAYVLKAIAYDKAGNTATSTITVTVDNTLPTAAINSPTNDSYLAGVVTVEVYGDDANFDYMELYINGSLVNSWTTAGTQTYSWNTTQYIDGTYVLLLKVYDKAGNVAESTVTVVVDNTAPTVAITSPSDGSYLAGVQTITVDANDANFNRVELYINGTLVSTWTTPGTNSYTWNTTQYADGVYILEAKAYDKAGNVATTSITVTVDNTAPTATINSPTDGALVSGTVTVSVYGDDANFDYMELYINGTIAQTWTTAGTQTYSWDTTTLSDGICTLTLKVYDKAGNAATDSVTVTIDNTAPTVTIMAPADGETIYEDTFWVNWTATDASGIDYSEVYLNGTLYATVTNTSLLVTVQTSGTYIIQVTSYDKAGNAGSDSVTVTVTLAVSVQITSPTNQTYIASDTVTVEWRGQGTIDHYEISLDGAAPINVGTNTSYTFAGLAEGYHNVTVYAIGVGGEVAKSFVEFYVDITPPSVTITAPENGSYLATSTVTIQWSGSDNYGIDHCELYVNGTLYYNGTGTSYTATLSEGVWVIEVKAYDYAGNYATDSITITVDLTAPSVTIVSPTNDTVTASASIDVSWTGDDNYGVDHYELYVNGTLYATTTGTSYTVELSPGLNEIVVKAYDLAGNSATSLVRIYVDTVPPSVAITSPSNGSYLATSTVTIEWSGSDDYGIDHYELYINGTLYYNGTGTSYVATLADGYYIAKIVAYDKVGHTAEDVVQFYVDTTAPSVTITSPGNNSYIATSTVTVEWAGSDNIAVDYYELYINGTLYYSGTGTDYTVTLADGYYIAKVVAYDKAGNYAESIVEFYVDTTAPSVTITFPANGTKVGTTFTLRWNASDATSGISEFEVYLNGSLVAQYPARTTSHRFENLTEGYYTIEVVAYDKAGNVASSVVNVEVIPLYVAIVSPSEGEGVPSSNVTVELSYSDSITRIELKLNGTVVANATPPETTYVLTGLNDGAWLLEAVGYDAAGNYVSDSVLFYVDTVPPTISITAPANGTYTNSSTVTVTWTASDAYLERIEIWVNGSLVATLEPGATSYDLTLSEGNNTIVVKAYDVAGNTDSDTVWVVVDLTSPAVSLLSSTAGYYNTSTITISWSAEDKYGIDAVYVYIDGSLNYTGGASRSYTVTLADGEHIIEVVAYDTARNKAVASAAIVVDTVAPEVTIVSPTEGEIIESNEVNITWTVSDDNLDKVEVFLNGSLVGTYTGSRSVVVTVEESGNYTVTAVAYDKAGNKAVAEVSFTVEIVLAVEIVSPEDGSLLKEAVLEVNVTSVADVLWMAVLLNGTLIYNGTVSSVPLSFTSDGKYTVKVIVKDSLGNIATDAITVIADVTPPIVEIEHPVNGTYTKADAVEVTWSWSDYTGVKEFRVYLNGELVAVVTGTSYTIELPAEGIYVISVEAIDAVGNVGKAEVTVIRDITPPTISIVSPKNNTYTNKGSVVIEVEYSDNFEFKEYAIIVDGELVAKTSARAVTVPIKQVEGAHIIKLVAYDMAGNEASTQVVIILDLTPPKISIVEPEPMSVIDTENVTISWTATDNYGIEKHELYIDGKLIYSGDRASYVVTLTDGSHEAVVKVYDLAGNIGEASVQFVVQTGEAGEGVLPPISVIVVIILLAVIPLAAFIYAMRLKKGKRRKRR